MTGAPVPLLPGLPGLDDPRLDALRRRPQTATPEAARQVETLFLTQLLKEMRKTVPDSDFLPRSAEREVYEGAFDEAVAGAIAKGDPLGLVARLGGAPLKNSGPPADTAVGKQESGRNTRP